MKNMKVPNVLGGAGISVLLKLGIVGGIGLYAAANNLYNVEGVGVKDKSPKVTSEVVAITEDINDMSFISAQSAEVTSHTTDLGRDGLLEEDENGAEQRIV
ncbi:hypothetical protein JHK82_055771 [Glycine max]|nr:hypothetical protein JHK82_055771 [Glycine max]